MENAPARTTNPSSVRFSLRRDWWYVAVMGFIIALDQGTKWLITQTVERGESWPESWPVRIVHVLNSGAAFGILQDSGPLLIITSLVGVTAILIYLLNPGFAHPVMRLGLALMFAGAVGNLIDRINTGEVVDFIKFPNWPAFNVADSAITIGVLCLLWTILFAPQDDEPETGNES